MSIIQTGSRAVVCNVWSNEAREASAEARKNSENATTPSQHEKAMRFHSRTAAVADDANEKKYHTDASNAHKTAMNAAVSSFGKSKDAKVSETSQTAQMKSKQANAQSTNHARAGGSSNGKTAMGFGRAPKESVTDRYPLGYKLGRSSAIGRK